MPTLKVKSQKLKVKSEDPERGYTLIELLVVVTIIAIISIMVFANYRGFSKDQVLIKATGQIQSLITLARSNASSGLKCASEDTVSSSEWYVKFIDTKNIKLYCLKPNATPDVPPKQTLTLDQNIFVQDVNPAPVTCKNPDNSALGFADGGTFTVSFRTISGEVKFFLNDVCEPSTPIATVPVTVQHTKTGAISECGGGDAVCRTFNINRGGVVDAGE